MKTVNVTPEEMSRRTVRFKDLTSYQEQQERASHIPMPVLERIAAHRVYPVMVPENYVGRSAFAPLKGAPGLSVNIAECPPGDGPGLHAHETTIENFLCLNGRFKILWGDHGEHSLILGPLDLCSVPPGVSRAFVNVSDETARLLVIIQIPTAEQADRVAYAPEVGVQIEREFGKKTIDALAQIGFKFDAGI
ncbi:MAG: cupin domain-containing protein [Candidatus Rokubacteria bacterium]|nr:cupin domain-containing protein [Candidatus Rokubacteria bacterium]